jgi:GTP-binding protein Era
LDVYIWIIDGANCEKEKDLLEEFSSYLSGVKKLFLFFNKIDLLDERKVYSCRELGQELVEKIPSVEKHKIYFGSASRGDEIENLISDLKTELPEQIAPFYDPDEISDLSVRFFVEEFIREAIIEETFQELPYSSFVLVDDYTETPKIDHIQATIFVERDGQKGIIIGRGGEKIKAIGSKARQKIETFLGKQVNLKLRVKVYKNWTKSEDFMKRTPLKKYLRLISAKNKKKKKKK